MWWSTQGLQLFYFSLVSWFWSPPASFRIWGNLCRLRWLSLTSANSGISLTSLHVYFETLRTLTTYDQYGDPDIWAHCRSPIEYNRQTSWQPRSSRLCDEGWHPFGVSSHDLVQNALKVSMDLNCSYLSVLCVSKRTGFEYYSIVGAKELM